MSAGRLRFAGVIGWPLGVSLSPEIHNAAFRALDMDRVYLPFPVPPEHLEGAVDGLRALGAMGANVTMPHKERTAGLMNELSGDAAALRTVNTIQVAGTELIGHNTDVEGFAGFLRDDLGLDAGGSRCLLLGAGGAARAVLRALETSGAAGVVVAARNAQRAASVARLAPAVTRSVSLSEAAAEAESADLIVNATPLGTYGEDPLPGYDFRSSQIVVDLIYHPPTTPLLERARAQGADAWGGLGMLVLQAALSFRIWTGQDPPLDVMSAAAVRRLGSTRAPSVPKELERRDET